MTRLKKNPLLGEYLREMRIRRSLSQADVAKHLALQSPQSISDWERGYGSSIPVPALKKLIKLYALDSALVFEILLDYQQAKLESKLHSEFFGKIGGKRTGAR